ncbi:MAG TPA: DUF1569 domain-containing protein [Phycisphaerales bacterium]|nr:DUF1569 domain-containing protein [Phycisphaerales bacterium]
MIKTKSVANRRTLRFGRMTDILKDAESLDANGSDKIRSLGNWTPAQVVHHVNLFIVASLDGFNGSRAPLPMRIVGRLIRSSALNKPLKPGFKVPSKEFEPAADVSWDKALSDLRTLVARINKGERMKHPSPMFGTLAHEEWEQLHCRHAEMHFSFLTNQ